ncbi:MAG: radical SAM protein, partial [Promethearchaeota archaeon]
MSCKDIKKIQINLGYLCNKECTHCHIQASPNRTESMSWETMQSIIRHANQLKPQLVDITGGAPEMNSHLSDFIAELTKHGHQVQVRTNLTALLDSEREDLIKVYRDHCVKLVASLPCYESQEVDSVR